MREVGQLMTKVPGRREWVYRQQVEARKEGAVLRTAIRDLRTVAEQIAILMTRPGLSLKEMARLNK
jgi:hypothetical protein